jgi:hypothetical protein
MEELKRTTVINISIFTVFLQWEKHFVLQYRILEISW